MPFDDASYEPFEPDDTPNQRLLKRVLRDKQFQTGMEALIRFTINRLLKEQGDTSPNGHEPLS